VGRRPGVMAAIRRSPAMAGIAFVLVGCLLVFGVFLMLVRSIGSDASPALLSAQGMAHRLLTGRESIDTDVESDREYVFRVVYQASDGNVGSTLYATHIGVAVCLRDGRATQAARFSYLHFSPSCTAGHLDLRPVESSTATDRARWRGDFAQDADAHDEPTPRMIGGP
jgi:hypothetical protein